MYIVTSFVFAVLQVAAVTSGDCPESSLSSRTLGSDAPAHEPSPWHAVIYRKKPDAWVPLCGGTLVSPSHVVTAANCFWSHGNRTSINLALFEVALGKHCELYETLEQDMQLFKVKAVTLHPWYSALSTKLEYDVAVVELKTVANITSAVSLAMIERKIAAGGEHLPTGISGTVAGWVGNESRSLSSVQLPYLNYSACADLVHARHFLVPSVDKFCAGAKDNMGTLCRQDLGDGYVYRHPTSNQSFLRGVLSTDLMATQFTETCHEIDVAGFTNMADPLTLNWLTQIIPAPAVPCPAVETSVSVSFVYCHNGDDDVDCSRPMTTGTTAVTRCSTGYHVTSNRKSKTSKCTSDGTWTDADVTCVQVDACQPSPCGPNSSCSQMSGKAVCSCLPTFIGSPPNCRPECVDNSECSQTQGCVQNKCTDVCAGACAEHAECTVVDHNPQCSCLPGYTGDARTNCTLIPVILCPAPGKTHGVLAVTCLRDNQLLDCLQSMAPGTQAVLSCSQGCRAGNISQKLATCLENGTWANGDVTSCVPVGYESLPGLGNLYKFHVNAVQWSEAKTTCEAEGSHLVILNSSAEFTAVKNLLKMNKAKIIGGFNSDDAWVGLKESDSSQDEFFTVFGEPMSSTGFSRWQTGYPRHKTLGDVVTIATANEALWEYPVGSTWKFAFTCELEVR